MKGQALVEYLLLFATLALISINIIRAIHGYFGDTIESLNYVLQEQLSVGVCGRNNSHCYFDDGATGFINR